MQALIGGVTLTFQNPHAALQQPVSEHFRNIGQEAKEAQPATTTTGNAQPRRDEHLRTCKTRPIGSIDWSAHDGRHDAHGAYRSVDVLGNDERGAATVRHPLTA